MAIPESLQIEYTVEVPLQLVKDRDGTSFSVTDTASVGAEITVGEGGDVCTLFNEGPGVVWFKLGSAASGRATYGSVPVAVGDKEVFVLPNHTTAAPKSYISLISRVDSKATLNVFPRGT